MIKYNKLFAILFALFGVQTLHAETDYTNLMSNDWTNSSGGFQGGKERYQGANFDTGKILYQSFTAPATGIYEIKFYAVASSTSGRGFSNVFGDNIAQAYLTAGSNKTVLSMTVMDQTGCTLAEASNLRTLSVEAEEGETIEYGIENIATGGNWYTAQKVSAKMKTVAEIYQSQYDEAYKIWQHSTENEVGAKATFKSSVDAMLAAMDGTLAGAQTVSDNLAAAQAIYESKSYPIKGHGVKYDYTSRMNMAINAWTCKQGNGPAQYGHTGATETYDVRNSGEVMYQEITGLPSGEYEIHFYAVANAANGGGTAGSGLAYVYANDQQMDIDVILQNGCTPSDYERVFTVMVSNGTIKYGVTNKAVAGNWYVCKNVALYMTGAPDLSDYYDAIASKLETANGLVASKMNANDKTALQKAIDATNGYTSVTIIGSLEEMDAALKSAIADANASVADYEKLQKYINMTKDFTDVAAYESKYNNGEYTTDDVETVRQELNVLTAEYVKTNFKNEIVVNEWTGSMGTARGQHWDGTTDGTTGTEYYDGNSWGGASHSKTANVTLPEGTYVFKAAGRSHASATLTLTVGETVVTFNGKGDVGYGIDTDGNANFSNEGTYANDGNGRGWEWQFVKFTLDEEATVTFTANSNYNGITGAWASFANIGLWMDDATYLTANGDAVNAPKAEAEALVNTKPMGEAENTALANAIAAAEIKATTPAELNAQIEALNAAVENAKAWLVTYNEAKAPLVAAMERFEADYNDGANGALRPMKTDWWTALLEAVQGAANAKDATDSYDGFKPAADALNAAMDAIDNAYAAEGLLQDMTHLIGNADCKANDAWPGTGRSTRTGEHWSGDANRVYFAQNHEDGAARTQTVTLPKTGTYYLKVAVRAIETGSYVDIIINGKSNKTTGAHGRVGGTIATDGTEWESVDAGLEEGKTFANDNKGYGWVYKHIYFDAEAGEATIALSLSNFNSNREANVGGMELYYVTIGDELILNETAESIGDVDGWYKSVTVNRTIKANNTWNTFVVPFDMEVPEGWEVKKLANSTVNGDNITLNFSDAQDGIKSGVPYMVRVTEQVSSIEVENVTVNTTLKNASTDDIEFVGVYENGNVPEGSFFISSNTFYRAANNSNTLKAFRAYLQPKGGANIKAVGYSFDDVDATFIEGVESAETALPVAVYGADGALRAGLQKGLNIVKMSDGKVKKVFVK